MSRAFDLLAQLSREVTEWQATDPSLTDIPSVHWALLVADAIHNFRSALDQLVFQLALINGSRDPSDRTQFPIADTRGRFKRQARVMLADIAPAHRAVIEGFQPFQADEDAVVHPLRLLRDLSNIDKHRILQILTTEEPPEGSQLAGPYLAIGSGLPLQLILTGIGTMVDAIVERFEEVFHIAVGPAPLALPAGETH